MTTYLEDAKKPAHRSLTRTRVTWRRNFFENYSPERVEIMTTSKRWTAEARARQAELIRTWAPWTKSTGPKSVEGKRQSGQNGRRANPMRRELVDMLAELKLVARQVKDIGARSKRHR